MAESDPRLTDDTYRHLRVHDPRAGIALLSGTIAYFLIFTIVPALTAFVLFYSTAVNPQTMQNAVTSFGQNMPPSEARLLTALLDNVLSSSTGLRSVGGIVSLVLALWGLMGGALAIISCIGIYSETKPFGFVNSYWRALLIALHLLATITLTIAGMALTVVVPAMFPANGPSAALVTGVIAAFVSLLVLAWLFSSINRLSQVGAPNLLGISLGGLLAAFLFVAGSALFTIYVENFGKYNATYGAMAGMIVLILWLRLAAFSLLLGAKADAHRLRRR